MRLTRTQRWSWYWLGMVAAAAGVLLLTACGDEDAGVEAAAPSAVNEPITITALDYAFDGVPETVAVGTTFTLVNASDVEVHELIAMRIADGETRPVAELFQLSNDELVGVVAERPAMVLVALPASGGRAVLGDGAFREPGRYALVCFIPTGADPQAYLAAAMAATDGPPQVAGGPPHFIHGMFAEVVVE